MVDSPNTNTVPLSNTGDLSLASLLTVLVDETVQAGTQSELSDRYAPSAGRVGVVGDTVYVGDGQTWQPAAAYTALLGSRSWRRAAAVTSNTTLSDQGVIQPVDTSGNAVTVTLASAMAEDGAEVLIKDEGGNAATNAVTVDTEGSESIDGATSQSIASNYGVLRLYSDGSNWYSR